MKRVIAVVVLVAYFYAGFRYLNWYCPRNPALDDGGNWHFKFLLAALAVYIWVCAKHEFPEPFLGIVFGFIGLLVAAWGVSAHYYHRAASEGWFNESSVAGTEIIDRFNSALTSSSIVVAMTIGLIGFYFVSRALNNRLPK